MAGLRVFVLLLFGALMIPHPATAQYFWLAPDFKGAPLASYEPGAGVAMPGATVAEQRAAIAWNMRSGLNVAALQCGNEPVLRTLENYNAILSNHSTELKSVLATLTGYFKRVNKNPRLADRALDSFGTKTYSGFSAVSGLRGFCTVSSQVSRDGLFTPRGKFAEFAANQLRTLRNSLIFKGDQQFRGVSQLSRLRLPRLDEQCWKKNRYLNICGFNN